MNSGSLTLLFELCRGKLRTWICWNYFQIPPTKLVDFPESGLKHVQFVHNFCSSNIFHSIKFWYLRISINNQQIILKINVIGEALGCCWWNYIHKTHLKGAFGLSGSLDLAFLFIEEILHEVQKGYGSILSYTSSQALAVSPAINYLLDLCPNLWCINSKAIFLLFGFFFEISILFSEKACFLTALCGNVTALSSFAPKYTVQNHLWKRHVCPEFINVMM